MNVQARYFLTAAALLGVCLILIFGLGDSLTPLLIAGGLAYLLFPLIKKLEKRGIRRNLAIGAVLLLFGVISIISTAIIVPKLIAELTQFSQDLPLNFERATHKIDQLATDYGLPFNIGESGVKPLIIQHLKSVPTEFIQTATRSIGSVFSGVTKWLLGLLNLFLIPLFFFYVINDYEQISALMKSLVPKKFRPKAKEYIALSNRALSGYIRGQCLVALFLAALYGLGLFLVGLPFGLLIGVVSGLISIVPYAGFTIGFATSIIVALVHDSGMGVIIGVVTVFVLVQALEGFVITPKLVGDKVGLSAFATILALIIGGNLLGFAGLLLAIPLGAIVKTIFLDLKKEFDALEKAK